MRRRKLQTIVKLDGEYSADSCGNDGLASGSSHETMQGLQLRLLNPELLQESIEQTSMVEALINIICHQLEKDEKQANLLFRAICGQVSQIIKFPPNSRTDDRDHISPYRDYYQLCFERLICSAKKGGINGKENAVPSRSLFNNISFHAPLRNDIPLLNYNISLFQLSRYMKEFQEIEKIDKGGGGTVYKAKYKIDGCLYAVKKIPLEKSIDQDSYRQIFKEVEVLANLNHPNIVTYKTSWIDYCLDAECTCVSSDDMTRYSSNAYSSGDVLDASDRLLDVSELQFIDTSNEINNVPRIILIDDDHPSDEIASNSTALLPTRQRTFSRSLSYTSSKSCLNVIPSENPKSKSWDEVSDYSSTSTSNAVLPFESLGKDSRVKFCPSIHKPKPTHAILIIQMELCAMTLRHWLDERNKSVCRTIDQVDEKASMNIFQAILHGVHYYHSEDVIHRDLKPSNIFFNRKDKRPQIGDFGLATVAFSHSNTKDETGDHQRRFTSQIGTRPYASPEQLKSKAYDKKTDMYSLGIILIELFVPFTTDMEKYSFIDKVKRGEISQEMSDCWPVQTDLIKKLLSEDPTKRPSAIEILQSAIFEDCRNTRTLNNKIDMLNLEVCKMKCELSTIKCKYAKCLDENHQLKEAIEKLKSELQNLKMSS